MVTNADLMRDLDLILTRIQSASLPIYETLKQSLENIHKALMQQEIHS